MSKFIHPLFDPNSLYRIASQEAVWRDGGISSVRQFFLGRRRDTLRKAWGPFGDVPKTVQNWGYSNHVNQMIDGYLRRARESVRNADAPNAQPASSSEPQADSGTRTPGLVVYDLSAGVPKRGEKVHRDAKLQTGTFTGCGLTDGGNDHLEFRISVPHKHDGRLGVAFLLPLEIIRGLARYLGRDNTWEDDDEDETLMTLDELFKPDWLMHTEDLNLLDKRCRLSSALSQVAGLEKEVAGGRFIASAPLDGMCPGPENGTLAVCCFGPTADELLEAIYA